MNNKILTLDEVFGIRAYPGKLISFDNISTLDKSPISLTKSLAINDFHSYPMVIELGNVLTTELILRLKEYAGKDGEVFYIFTELNSDSELPDKMILKVECAESSRNLWLYFDEGVSRFPTKYYSVHESISQKDTCDISYGCQVYFNSKNIDFVDFLNKTIPFIEIKEKSTKESFVEMITSNHTGLITQKIKFDFNYSNDDLNLHYGSGFNDFHEKLLFRMLNKDKGIVMLHGPPGNGKTHYIRRLLPALNEKGKRIILIPKHILGSLEGPVFNQFMLQYFVGQKVVFVMEDAESIISKRNLNNGERSELVSTLLNITDGILNDIFNIQVILTFNTEIQNIDDALLRTGRLLAKHEFKNLTLEEANKLADHLGVSLDQNKSMYSLSDVYSYLDKPEDNDVLINQKDYKNFKISELGF